MTKRKETSPGALWNCQVLIMFACCAAVCSTEIGKQVQFEQSIIMGCFLEAGTKIGEGIFIFGSDEAKRADDYMLQCAFRRKGETKTACISETMKFKDGHWPSKNLTYKVSGYANGLDISTTNREIAKAFDMWSQYTDLTFTSETENVDITIKFVSRSHGDLIVFDGRTPDFMIHNALTHIFVPENNTNVEVHFDSDDVWSADNGSGQNLLLVAVHAFGHVLGLQHSENKWSIMYPHFDSNRGVKLYKDDIAEIQALYGEKTTNEVPDICHVAKIDTIFKSAEGLIYIFIGKYYWTVSSFETPDRNLQSPSLISTKWKDLPANIDAAFTDRAGRTFFFKGSKYWTYLKDTMVAGSPRLINDTFRGIPNNIDAVTMMYGSRQIWFSKETEYWLYDDTHQPQVDPSKYPEPNNYIQGVPDSVDAVLNEENFITFFEGTDYYRQDKRSYWWNTRSPKRFASEMFHCPATPASFLSKVGSAVGSSIGAIGNLAKNALFLGGKTLNF